MRKYHGRAKEKESNSRTENFTTVQTRALPESIEVQSKGGTIDAVGSPSTLRHDTS